jgi:hypothetical protein
MVALGRVEGGHIQHLTGVFDVDANFLPGNMLWFGHGYLAPSV